ncbi:MAG: undecaprenyl-diphosphate phosphatase [Planctomycetota bacterium]
MTPLTYAKAILLGVIQGLTEFLPVSSSAHLAITQRLLGLEADSLPILLFDAVAHIGTVVAVVYVFAAPLKRYVLRLVLETRPAWRSRKYAWRITFLGIVASIPTAAIGLAFKEELEAAFGKPFQTGVELCITGVLLMATAAFRHGRRGWKGFLWWHAGIIGIAQGLAILPGISRSGATICAAQYLGIRRRWAAEFSFFIAIPAILGATAVKFKDLLEARAEVVDALPWGPILTGSLISLIVGVVSLRLLVSAVRRAKLHYFAFYCWAAGLLVLLNFR